MPFLKALPLNKLLILVVAVVIIIGLVAAGYFFLSKRTSDSKNPELYLTNLSPDEWLNTDEDKVTINGIASDENDIKDVKWENQNGQTGSANVSGGQWSIQDIPLSPGDNQITITATDTGGNTSSTTVNVVYNADVLFSDLTLSQDFIFKDDPATNITARASVETKSKKGIGKVNLYNVTGGQNKKLTSMLDNGVVANGDDIPGDTVFSGIESFSSSTNDTIQLRIGATVGSSTDVSLSGVLELKVLNKPTKDQLSTIFDLNKEFSDRFEELKKGNDAKEAAKKLVEELEQRSEIAVSGVSEDGFGVWWAYEETGILAGIQNNPEDTRGAKEDKQVETRKKQEKAEQEAERVKGVFDIKDSPVHFGISKAHAAEPEKKVEVKSTKALYLGPYLHQFKDTDDYHKAWKTIKENKCPECQTTEKKDKEVKVEDFKTLSNYGLVVIVSHGDTWFNGKFAGYCKKTGDCPEILKNGGGFVNIFVDHVIDENTAPNYIADLLTWRLAFDASDNTLAVLPPYIAAYNGTFPNSLVYVGACRSSHNLTMAAPFLAKGAKGYLGFSTYVKTGWAGKVVDEFYKSFMEKGKSASESFKDATDAHGEHDGGKPTRPPAYLNYVGEPALKMGGREIQNGSFEEGLVGWQAEGDSRVINRLAGLTPRDGKKMAIISTGLGSVNNSNSAVIQKICVPEGKLTLSFKFDVVSEEPLEYVGSRFDDNFIMTVTINGKAIKLVERRINNSSWKKIGGINFAGGDATTYHTGWKTLTKDLGKVKADDKVQIEFRVSDKGDSIYDTAALIDSVKLEVN